MSWPLLLIPVALLGWLAGEVEFRWVRHRLRRKPTPRALDPVRVRLSVDGMTWIDCDTETLERLVRYGGELVETAQGASGFERLRFEVGEQAQKQRSVKASRFVGVSRLWRFGRASAKTVKKDPL